VLPVFIETEQQPERALRRTLELIEQAHRAIAAAGDEVRLCLTGADIDAALDDGAIALLLALEGCRRPACGPSR